MRDFNEILLDVKSRIARACERSGRKIDEVEIIAVTKTHGTETVDEAWRHGLTIMGENKVQEALWKKPASQSDAHTPADAGSWSIFCLSCP